MATSQLPDFCRKPATNVAISGWVSSGVRIVGLVISLAICAMIAWFWMTGRAVVVTDSAMAPLIFGNDEIHAEMTAYGVRLPMLGMVHTVTSPKSGDIVLLSMPTDTRKRLIRRVIAHEGQQVKVYGDGTVDVQGQPLPLCSMGRWFHRRDPNSSAHGSQAYVEWIGEREHVILLSDRHMPSAYCGQNACTVPPGHVFVMGDNRRSSDDSRKWGFVNHQLVLGKVDEAEVAAELPAYRICKKNKPELIPFVEPQDTLGDSGFGASRSPLPFL